MLREQIIKELLEPFAKRFLGPKRWIYCYKKQDGGVPARTFLEQLEDKVFARYARSFLMVVDGMQHKLRGVNWHKLAGYPKLYEFKDISSQTRLIHTTDDGGLFILLYGLFGKNEDKIEKGHLLRAQSLCDEYLGRRAKIEKRPKGRRK